MTPPASKVIPLGTPIELISARDGTVVDRISEVTFRRPKSGDMVAAMDACGGDQTRVGSMLRAIVIRCCSLTDAQFDDLEPEDGQVLLEEAMAFLGNGPRTGQTPAGSSSPPSASPATGEAGTPPTSGS